MATSNRLLSLLTTSLGSSSIKCIKQLLELKMFFNVSSRASTLSMYFVSFHKSSRKTHQNIKEERLNQSENMDLKIKKLGNKILKSKISLIIFVLDMLNDIEVTRRSLYCNLPHTGRVSYQNHESLQSLCHVTYEL